MRLGIAVTTFFLSIAFFIAWNELVILPFQSREVPPNYKPSVQDSLFNQAIVGASFISMVTGLWAVIEMRAIMEKEAVAQEEKRFKEAFRTWILACKVGIAALYAMRKKPWRNQQ